MSLWMFMGIYEYLWIFMGFYGCYGYLWVSMGAYGLLGVYGYLWVSMGVYRFLVVYEYLRVAWVSMGIIFKHKKYCLFSYLRTLEDSKTPKNVRNHTCIKKNSVCTTGRGILSTRVFSVNSQSSIKSLFSPLVHNILFLWWTVRLNVLLPSVNLLR